MLRAFRQLCSLEVCKRRLGEAERRKRAKYAAVGVKVIPFAITSLGSVGGPAQELLEALTRRASYDVGEQSKFFRWLVTRISILLICAGALMAREVRRARDWRGC